MSTNRLLCPWGRKSIPLGGVVLTKEQKAWLINEVVDHGVEATLLIKSGGNISHKKVCYLRSGKALESSKLDYPYIIEEFIFIVEAILDELYLKFQTLTSH
jgi:hypothetical protein